MTVDRALTKVFGKALDGLKPEELGVLKMEVESIMRVNERDAIDAAKIIYNEVGRVGLQPYVNTLMGQSEAMW